MKINYEAVVEKLFKSMDDMAKYTLPSAIPPFIAPKRQKTVMSYDDLVSCIQQDIQKLPGVFCLKDREPIKKGTHVSLSETSEIVLDCLMIDPVDDFLKRPSLISRFDDYSRWIIGFGS